MAAQTTETDDITVDDVKAIRLCAEELQIQNCARYGPPGLESLRTRSQRALAAAEKLEKRLRF